MLKGNIPQSHFVKGILVGFFSSLFGAEVGVNEVACIKRILLL